MGYTYLLTNEYVYKIIAKTLAFHNFMLYISFFYIKKLTQRVFI